MKNALVFVLIAAAFGAGYFLRGRSSGAAPAVDKPGEKKILYWYDPMHPAYKSDKAGIAPDCGMQLAYLERCLICQTCGYSKCN